MKINTLIISVIFPFIFFLCGITSVSAQCEPMGPDLCPDPENNGQICPDTMPLGYLNQSYAEVATILVPEEDSTGIQLHHLTLVAVDNLPPGVSWVSNAPNNEFMAGNYYCILLEGTPSVADTFYLKIVIDIYIDLLGQPVLIMQVVDSTSLSMIIEESGGLGQDHDNIAYVDNHPNPFNSWTNIRFVSKEAVTGKLEIYSLQGAKIYSENITMRHGENDLLFKGEFLPPGTYCYVIRSGTAVVSRLMVKAN